MKKGQNHGLNGLKDDTDYSTSEKSESIKSVQSINPCKSVIQTGYKQTEVGVIPEEWDSLTLGELFTFKNGLNKGKVFFGYGTPIVNYMDVYETSSLYAHELKGRVNVTKPEIKAFEVKKGDVFFTRTSETIDEVGIASVMLDEPIDTVFSGFILRARPHENRLDDQYKKYCFASHAVRSQIISTSTYTTRALTNGRVLSGVSIACPPLPEQRAIAAALSDVDALLAKLDQLIAKKRDLKQATMQQLLTGQTRLPGFSGEWDVRRLGDVVRYLCWRGRRPIPFQTPCEMMRYPLSGLLECDHRFRTHRLSVLTAMFPEKWLI